MKEKRQNVRVKIEHDYPVEVQIMGDVFLDVLEAKDISTSGVGVVVPHEFSGCDINKEVDLIITLLDETPFKAKGIIRHKNDYDSSSNRGYFSVEFTELPYENREMIDNFIRERLDRK